ncbi:MAG: hypothetical protein V3U85_09005 [Hyphomicrobium sp.]
MLTDPAWWQVIVAVLGVGLALWQLQGVKRALCRSAQANELSAQANQASAASLLVSIEAQIAMARREIEKLLEKYADSHDEDKLADVRMSVELWLAGLDRLCSLLRWEILSPERYKPDYSMTLQDAAVIAHRVGFDEDDLKAVPHFVWACEKWGLELPDEVRAMVVGEG